MNITDAHHMARRLMNDHGLGHIPFEFDGGKRRLGCTHFVAGRVSKITLSRHYTVILPEDEIRDVILHEIAHAIAGASHGHDYTWKRIAASIGAKPERCAAPSASVGGHAWIGKCAAGHESKMHRAPRRLKACGQCATVWKKENVLVWHFNGRRANLHQMPETFQREYTRHFPSRLISV